MNIAFLPDLFALALLIVILAMVRRRHSDVRADAWLVGLSFTLIESLAHTFYAPQGVPDKVLHVIVLDCYVMAGIVFNWAAGDEHMERKKRVLYLSMNARGLVRELLDSLDDLPSQELDRLWLEEANRRATQLDAGKAELVSGDEVDRKARALLR